MNVSKCSGWDGRVNELGEMNRRVIAAQENVRSTNGKTCACSEVS